MESSLFAYFSYLAPVKVEWAGKSLSKYLNIHGFQTNISYINRGEALQENVYQAISQFALGLIEEF